MTNVSVNGKIVTIGREKDIFEIIEEYCGYDFARVVQDKLLCRELTLEERGQVLKESDYYNYEASLGDWNCVENDVIEECESRLIILSSLNESIKKSYMNRLERFIKL